MEVTIEWWLGWFSAYKAFHRRGPSAYASAFSAGSKIPDDKHRILPNHRTGHKHSRDVFCSSDRLAAASKPLTYRKLLCGEAIPPEPLQNLELEVT